MEQQAQAPDQEPLRSYNRIFFVGIGGISMGGLAEIALAGGHLVAGSDRSRTPRTDELSGRGMTVFIGHSPAWIDDFRPDLVVYTAAVHTDNPERIRAGELGITTVDRATFLGWINRTFRRVINIAGTHGKTTTTAICALILIQAGVNPTVHLGAELKHFHGTVRLGQPGGTMVSEACEYTDSFLRFFSTTAAVLNIDYDHVDYFPDLQAVITSFARFAASLPAEGVLVVPDYDEHVRQMLDRLPASRQNGAASLPRLLTFGFAEPGPDEVRKDKPADFSCRQLTYDHGLPRFEIWHRDRFYCAVSLQIPGRHNVANALAAVACAHANGGTPDAAAAVLNHFQGAEGRFTAVGSYHGAQVIADYAHHPAAARVTLAAADQIPHQHMHVIFQPLTFSRTKVLFNDYVAALRGCEEVLFTEIYSDRETNPGDISSRMLADRINELGGNACFFDNYPAMRAYLDDRVGPDDLILVLGPENVRNFADQLTGRISHLD
jgi:UDP-N-acetylmuramate--alanine ligase